MKSIGNIVNKKFMDNALRRQICSVNWNYHKPQLIESLQHIVSEVNNPYPLMFVYGNKNMTRPYTEGHDSILVKFLMQDTHIIYHESDSDSFDYENGAVLSIAHSDAGFDTMFLYPARSKQSGAEHQTLILYHSDDGRKISDSKLKRLIGNLVTYHMYTSVLIRNTPLLRFKVGILKLRSFYYSYANPEKKFKYSSGIYIPLASLTVSLVALVVAIIALKIPGA